MTIDEVLRLLQQDLDDPGSVDIMDLIKAQTIAMEALKRIDHLRAKGWAVLQHLLPGETKD